MTMSLVRGAPSLGEFFLVATDWFINIDNFSSQGDFVENYLFSTKDIQVAGQLHDEDEILIIISSFRCELALYAFDPRSVSLINFSAFVPPCADTFSLRRIQRR